MIAGSRICSTSTRLTHPTITNETTPHLAEALPRHQARARACCYRRQAREPMKATSYGE
jgi:hypothetical protein